MFYGCIVGGFRGFNDTARTFVCEGESACEMYACLYRVSVCFCYLCCVFRYRPLVFACVHSCTDLCMGACVIE
jgi:hypothetical protein